MIWTILASVNLVCALLAYSFLAYALARLHWRKRGMALVLLAILICAHVWLIPQALITFGFKQNTQLYWFWFANWLVSGFAIIFLNQAVRNTPTAIADSARLDGCGAPGIYWHVLLPFVTPALVLLAILTVMSSTGDLLARGTELLRAGIFDVIVPNLISFIISSVIMTAPLFAIFFLARKLLRPSRSGAFQSAEE